MTGFIRDHTVKTVFVAIQATIIVYGILVTGLLMKGNGYPEYDHFFWFSKLVRHAGLLFFLAPAGWVWLTNWYEESTRLHPTTFTLATGFGLIAGLWWLFSISAAGAERKTFIHQGFGYAADRAIQAERGWTTRYSPRVEMISVTRTLNPVAARRSR